MSRLQDFIYYYVVTHALLPLVESCVIWTSCYYVRIARKYIVCKRQTYSCLHYQSQITPSFLYCTVKLMSLLSHHLHGTGGILFSFASLEPKGNRSLPDRQLCLDGFSPWPIPLSFSVLYTQYQSTTLFQKVLKGLGPMVSKVVVQVLYMTPRQGKGMPLSTRRGRSNGPARRVRGPVSKPSEWLGTRRCSPSRTRILSQRGRTPNRRLELVLYMYSDYSGRNELWDKSHSEWLELSISDYSASK